MDRRLRAVPALVLLAATAVARAEPTVPLDRVPPNPVVPYITVTASPNPIRPGQYTTITVTTGNFGGDGYLSLVYGDNSGGFASYTWDLGCGAVYPTLDKPAKLVLRHAYRYPGSYTISYSFTPHCRGHWLPAYTGSTSLVVEPGPPAPSNGPERPYFYHGIFAVAVGRATPTGQLFKFETDAYDTDGYMARLVYSWGDGTPDKVFTFPLSECVDPPDHWPQTGNDDPDNPPAYEFPTHRYARKGTYAASVTMTTTGCDGKHPQTTRAATKVIVK